MNTAFEKPVSPIAAEMLLVGIEAQRVSRFLDYADYAGRQQDGKGGYFELWNLRKAIPGHPRNSTVSRASLEAYLFPDLPPAA